MMENNYKTDDLAAISSTSGDELSIKIIIDVVRDSLHEIWRNKILIIIFCIPFLIWQTYVYVHTPTTYPARLTFMVNEDEGGQLSGITGLLGSFGIGANGDNNYERILELSRSMIIVSQVLVSRVEVEGKEDFLANHFIRVQKLHEEEWAKKDRNGVASLKDFYFKSDSIEKYSRLESTALKSLYSLIVGSEKNKPIMSAGINEDAGIMSIDVSARSEELSIVMIETFFEKLSDFYILKSIEKNKVTYDFIQAKVDSLRNLLAGTEYKAAAFEDKTRALLLNVDKVPQQRFVRDKQMLLLVYGEAIKNLEIADFALKNKTPYVQAIDKPFAPLSSVPPSKKRALLLSLGLGLLIGSVFVIIRKIILGSIIKDEK